MSAPWLEEKINNDPIRDDCQSLMREVNQKIEVIKAPSIPLFSFFFNICSVTWLPLVATAPPRSCCGLLLHQEEEQQEVILLLTARTFY